MIYFISVNDSFHGASSAIIYNTTWLRSLCWKITELTFLRNFQRDTFYNIRFKMDTTLEISSAIFKWELTVSVCSSEGIPMCNLHFICILASRPWMLPIWKWHSFKYISHRTDLCLIPSFFSPSVLSIHFSPTIVAKVNTILNMTQNQWVFAGDYKWWCADISLGQPSNPRSSLYR